MTTSVSAAAVFTLGILLVIVGCSGEGANQSVDSTESRNTKEPYTPDSDIESTKEPTANVNAPNVNAPDVESQRKQFAYVKPNPLGEPAAKFTLEDFAKDGEANAEKHKGQCIEISGKIANFGFADQAILNRHPESTYFMIQCATENLDFAILRFFEGQPWMSCTLGDTITVRGVCVDSMGSGVIMTHCELVDSPGKPVPLLTKELFQAAQDSGEEFDMPPLAGKAFRVCGIVESIEKTGFNDGIVNLKSHEGFDLIVKVEWLDWQYAKVGSEVTALSLGADFYIEDGQMEMSGLPARVDIFEAQPEQ